MKKLKLNTKLYLKKETLTKLENGRSININGGGPTYLSNDGELFTCEGMSCTTRSDRTINERCWGKI